MGGNSSPSSDDIKSVLSSVGIDADDDRVESLLKELDGKDISEVNRCWGFRYWRSNKRE